MKNSMLPLIGLCVFAIPAMGQKEVKKVDVIFSNARALQRGGDNAAAAAEMNKAIALEPNNARWLFEQSQFFEFANNQQGVLDDIDRAVRLDPDNEDTMVEAVRRLQQRTTTERCERALTVVNAFLVKHTQSDKAYFSRFFVRQCFHDDTGALSDITKAVELNPASTLYQMDLANTVSRMGDFRSAEQALKSLIFTLQTKLARTDDRGEQEGVKRDLGMALRMLSVAYERAGDKTLAIEALTRAITYQSVPYLRERALLYGRFEMYKEAIADFDQAIADDNTLFARIQKNRPPDIGRNMTLFEDRGITFEKAGEFQKALMDYQECQRQDPRNKAMYQKLIDRVTQKIEKPN